MEDNTIPAGLLGNFYSARNTSGQYHSCGLTSRYQSQLSDSQLIRVLKHALHQTITQHSGLCYGVTERNPTSESLFVRQESISWDDVVSFSSSSIEDPRKTEDQVLCEFLGRNHDVPWRDQWIRPAWKLFVLKHTASSTVDIVFLGHHAIGDGLSLAAFHRTLARYLQEALLLLLLLSPGSASESESEPQLGTHENEWPYKVPQDLTPPPFIENRIPLSPLPISVSTPAPMPVISPSSPLKPWAGKPIHHIPNNNKTRAYICTIPSTHLTSTTAYLSTELQKVSLTGYIHSLLLMHLTHHIPAATSFRGETPFSLRSFAGTGSEEMVNHISCIDNDFDGDLINEIRLFTNNQEEEKEKNEEKEKVLIEKIAAVYRAQLKIELNVTKTTGPSFLRDVVGIPDLELYCEEGLKKERGYTYELSNLGLSEMSLAGGSKKQQQQKLVVDKLVFTQSAMITGPAFGCNVIAVKGGKMTATFTWQDGIVDEELMVGCAKFIEGKFEEIHLKTKE